MTPGLLELAVIVRFWISSGGPALMPERLTVCIVAFSVMDKLPIAFSVGGSFTGLTVTVKLRLIVLLVAWPSFTVTVMVAVPLAFATGVKLSVPVVFGLV